MKAIIPAAGLGSRFLPATKAQPKEMLLVVDRPVIQYIVEEGLASAADEVVIVNSREKKSIEEHFSPNPELVSMLRERGKDKYADAVEHAGNLNVSYVYQDEPLGLGHAVHCAAEKTGNEPFDIWLQNIALHGFRNRTFHAQQLGITVPMLNGLVLALTGMLYADFVRELTYVIAKDLTRSQHYRFLNQVAEFLGYKAYSSLFRLIKQKENASPTRLTRMNNPEEQLII